MSLVEYAKSEMERAGLFREDSDYGGMLGDAVLKMVSLFADEGHSGMSASMALAIFNKVARFEPLTPLTGDDDEWNEVREGVFQNRRCSRVFKDADGRAYDIEGKVFRDKTGSYTSRDSRVYVTFPYTPTTEYVNVS